MSADAPDTSDALTLDHQRSRIDKGKIISPGQPISIGASQGTFRTATDSPVKRDSSTEKLVQEKNSIGGDPVSLGEHHEIAHHHFPPGYPSGFAIPDNQRPGTGQIP